MNRNELIEHVKNSVVPFRSWSDRDSFIAQRNLQFIYAGLVSELEYKITEDHDSIYLHFINVTQEQVKSASLREFELEIDSLDDYRDEYGYDSEMFHCEYNRFRIGDQYAGSLPSLNRLKNSVGGDWY